MLLETKKGTFTPPSIIHFFIVYESGTCSRDLNSDFNLRDCFFAY